MMHVTLDTGNQMSVKLLQATPSCGRNRGADVELAACHMSVMSFLYPLPSAKAQSRDNEESRSMVLCRTCNFRVS